MNRFVIRIFGYYDEQYIINLCECLDIKHIWISKNIDTSNLRGFSFIEFNTKKSMNDTCQILNTKNIIYDIIQEYNNLNLEENSDSDSY